MTCFITKKPCKSAKNWEKLKKKRDEVGKRGHPFQLLFFFFFRLLKPWLKWNAGCGAGSRKCVAMRRWASAPSGRGRVGGRMVANPQPPSKKKGREDDAGLVAEWTPEL